MDKRIEQYKATYQEMYGHRPSEKRIESFCRLYGIEEKEEEGVPESFWRDGPLDG